MNSGKHKQILYYLITCYKYTKCCVFKICVYYISHAEYLGVKRVYLRRFSVSIEGGLGREVMNQTISTVPVVGLSLGLRL